MSPEPPGRSTTRRSLLATAAGIVAAGGLEACGGGGTTAAGGPERTDDAEVINGAIDIEYLAAASYAAAIPHLSGRDAALARRVREHELAHAQALSSLIREMGAVPNQARASYPQPPRGRRAEILAFLAGVENLAIAYYVDAVPKLSGPLRHVALGVVASEAEHLAAVRLALGLAGAPQAFVWGRA